MSYLIATVVSLALACLGLWLRARSFRRRENAMRELLDGADALEAQIHDYKSRMLRLKGVLNQLPSDMSAPAVAKIDPESQVQTALREVLAHRLWIQREGASATQSALDVAVAAIQRSRDSLATQLALLDEVSEQLQQAGAGLRNAYQEASAAMSQLKRLKDRNGGQELDGPTQIRMPRPPENPTRH